VGGDLVSGNPVCGSKMWVGPLPGRTGLLCLCLSIVLATALEHEPQTEDEVPEKKYKVKEEDPEVSTTGGATTGQGWYLVGLRGNVSVVHQRLGDFLLYLRINLASIALTQYERVTVNSVSYKPTLLVNITFTGSYNTSRLEQLSQMEDSLFLLSYQPFHVTSFTAGTEILVARPVTNSLSTAREEEAIFYLGISGTIAFLLSAALMVCVLLLVNKRSRVRDKEPLIVPSSSASGSVLCQDAPHTIYSEHFSQDLAREKERLHSFTALDDSLCPITNMDLDFTPRYLREDDRVSWISEGSLPVPVDIHSDPGSNFFPSDGYRPVLSTFSEDGSITGPDTVDSRQSKSPFYWQSSTPTSSPVPRPSPLPPVLSRHPQKRNGKTPPRPPSRSDSLNPNSKTKIHSRPKSAAPMRTRASSGSPSSDFPYTSRPLSVPVPGHMSHYHQHSTPSSRHSSICAPSPTQCPSPRDIEKDVSHILSNLGIEETQ